MRRSSYLILGGILAALLSLYLLRPRVIAPLVEAPAQEPPQFKAVEVRASGIEQGLTLQGVVREPGGKPIADAEVFLSASSQPSLTGLRCGVCNEWLLSCRAQETARSVAALLLSGRAEQVPALSTRSDPEGRFRFERLVGVSFTVWGRAPGFGDGIKERAVPGETAELFLPQPRSLSGRLRDEAGLPVQGTVRIVSRRLARVLEAKADAEGRFRFSGLGEGPFAVSAEAPGRLAALEANAEAGAEPIVLTLPSPRRLEVRVLSNGKPIDATVLLEGDHLARRLEAQAGFLGIDELYPGELMVWAVAGELSSVPQRIILTGGLTQITLALEIGGTIAVTVLDDGEQPVVAPTLDLMTLARESVLTRKAQTGELSILGPLGVGEYQLQVEAHGYRPATVPVKVKPGETAVVVTLSKGTIISGRVIDEYGRAAPGISVLVTPTGDTVLADGEGRFVAAVPSPGLYELHAHHSDWGGGSVKVGAPKEGVELQLEPRAGAEIIVSAEGRRVEGASVSLFHSKGNFWSDRSSSADGVVLMRGLPEDTYTLIATHPDFLPSERQTLSLRDGVLQRTTAELKAGSKMTGQVVDTQGAPVPGAVVAVLPKGAEPAVADARGQFTLSPLRPNVLYAFRVVKKGFEQVDRTTAKPGGQPVRLVLRGQPVFRGRVLGDGQPLRNFRIDEHLVTSPDGRFELPLPATEDRVILTIEAPGFEPKMVDRPNSPDLGDFNLERAPQVTGIVRDEGGGAVVDAVVSCETCEQAVLTGPDGRFVLGKPAFQHEFTVVAKKGRRTGTRTVTEGALQGLELVLKPGTKLTGVAYLPNGQLAAGLEIAGINLDRGEVVNVVTNADGTYGMEVAPGFYRFVLALPGLQPESEDPTALIAEVSGTEARLDFGPVPSLGSLVVRLVPKPGHALWLIRGSIASAGNPPLELLRTSWAQMVFQPRVDRVKLVGIPPGRYTLVWSSFAGPVPGGPLLVPVSIPASGEVTLGQ